MGGEPQLSQQGKSNPGPQCAGGRTECLSLGAIAQLVEGEGQRLGERPDPGVFLAATWEMRKCYQAAGRWPGKVILQQVPHALNDRRYSQRLREVEAARDWVGGTHGFQRPFHPARSWWRGEVGGCLGWEGVSMWKKRKRTGLGGRDLWGPGDCGQVTLPLRTSVYPSV